MNNVCECKEKIEFELIDGQPTLMDIYKEMNRLKLENECLKADKYELQDEISQLRSDNIVLHNKINENSEENDDIGMINEYEEEYLCGCESEENLKAYDEALSNMSVRK